MLFTKMEEEELVVGKRLRGLGQKDPAGSGSGTQTNFMSHVPGAGLDHIKLIAAT